MNFFPGRSHNLLPTFLISHAAQAAIVAIKRDLTMKNVTIIFQEPHYLTWISHMCETRQHVDSYYLCKYRFLR